MDEIHTKTEKHLVCRHNRWELYERFTSSTRKRRRGIVKEVFYYVSYIHVFRLTCLFLLLFLRLTNGAAVRLTGRLVLSPGKEQSCELLVDKNDVGEVVILGECDPEASFFILLQY